MDKLMNGPLVDFLGDFVGVVFYDYLDSGAVFMILFVLLVGIIMGCSFMIIAGMI